MPKNTSIPGLNVVPMVPKAAESVPADDAIAVPVSAAPGGLTAGGPNDPRMKEAMRLMQAFLAIEDAPGRAALITLAERMVSYDWARKAQQG